VIVDEGTLRFHVSMLRKVLGDGKSGTRYVINVPGRGYSLVAPISRSIPQKVPDQKAHASDQRQKLPAPLTRMVGRDDAVRKITDQLSGHRFVTVVGPGGIGKTSVATGVAHALLPTFDGQVSFVDLGSLSEPQLVSSTIASTLGLMVNSEDSIALLLAFLQGRRMLLVLDNCEHVIETAAILAETIFNAAPSIHILATSRESLRVEGEHVHRLLPLNCPPEAADLSAADILGFSAPQLFVERAATAYDKFRLADADAPLVADICRKLDGIPLALELAAARIVVFGIKEMAARLDDRMLVALGRRTAMPRHQTLNATLDWSFEMLSSAEAELLCCLAMFAADFTVEAAIAVAPRADTDTAGIVTDLGNLVEKSLVVTDVGSDVLRYRLLNATRIYARRRLAEPDAVAHRHAEYHCELLQRANAEYESVSASRWVATYRASLSDVRAALDWCFSSNGDHSLGAILTIAAVPLWTQLSLMPECQRALERALVHDQAIPNVNPRRRILLYAAPGETLRVHARAASPREHVEQLRTAGPSDSFDASPI
jgi:predicted ATPase